MPKLSGVIAAAATPLRDDLSIDHAKLAAHCRWLLNDGGCDAVNLLGTTGEATSFSVEQRLAAMRAVAEAGLPMERFMVGTGASALEDAVRLTLAAKAFGFAGALLLPPFYYKGIDDESLVAYVDTVIAQVGGEGLGLYLYHIPQNTGVPWPIEVVAALAERHPDTLLGLKDSSGDIAYSTELAKRVPRGFAGCISATTNVTGPLARIAWHQAGTPEAEAAVAAAAALRAALSSVTLVPAVKDTLAEIHGDASWRRPHPPLRALNDTERATLREALAKTEYPRLFAR